MALPNAPRRPDAVTDPRAYALYQVTGHPQVYGLRGRPTGPSDAPNYEKLTRTERWIMDRLAGFGESDVGQAMAKFAESPAGKLLSYIDIPAEGVERFTGTLAQYLYTFNDVNTMVEDRKNFVANLGNAWYAGSLAADFANIPHIDESGKLRFPTDLPGVQGLVDARKKIALLVSQGMSPGDALVKVREEYYNEVGALALRSQINDALMHIAGDPLNVIMPFIHPVEALHTKRLELLTRLGSAAPDVEAAQKAATAAVDALAAAERISPEVARLSAELDAAVSAGRATDEIQQALDAARAATRNLPEVRTAEAALKESRAGLEAAYASRATTWEQRFLRLTGGIPGGEPTKLPGALELLARPFRLTPGARAHEFVTTILDNVTAYAMSKGSSPEEIARSLLRWSDGIVSPSMGHAIVTYEGRMTRGALGAIRAHVQNLLDGWLKTSPERSVLKIAEDALGETSHRIMAQLRDGEEVSLAARLAERLADNPDLAQYAANIAAAFGKPTLDADILGQIVKVFGDSDLYSADVWRLSLVNAITDAAAQQAIVQFGLKERGVVYAMSDAIKAGETLAFLKMNPTYPIRNGFNNFFTTIARGAYGQGGVATIEEFERKFGFVAPRLAEGFTPAGADAVAAAGKGDSELIRALEHGSSILRDAERPKSGWLPRFTSWMNERKGLGFADVARNAERQSSVRAFSEFYSKGIRRFGRPGGPIISKIDDVIPDHGLPQDVVRALEDAIADSRGVERKLDDAVLNQPLNLTGEGLMRRAEEKLGYQIDRTLSEDIVSALDDGLTEAYRRGDVDAFLKGVEQKIADHVEDQHEHAISVLVEQSAARVQGEGPQAMSHLVSDMMDEWYAGHERHAQVISRVARVARESGDEAASVVWRQALERERAFWGRAWDRLEARMNGATRAAKEVGIPWADQVYRQTRDWRKVWTDFFKKRDGLVRAYFDAREAGRAAPRTWDDIINEIDGAYEAAIGAEDKLLASVDGLVGRGLEGDAAGIFNDWRSQARALRLQDRQLVAQFRRQVRSGVGEADWEAHWQQRMDLWRQIRQLDNAGKTALAGNPESRALFMAAPAEEAAGEVAGVAGEVAGKQQTFLPDLNAIVPEEEIIGPGLDQLWYTRGQEIFDTMRDVAGEPVRELRFANLPPEQQKTVRAYLEHARGGLADARYASIRFGEYGRDAALLNYNRRYNYNNWLGTIMPYEFWLTQSMFKWALHSIDRPAMLSTALRLKKFMETAYRPEPGLPSRLRGSIRLHVPFLPTFMGDWAGDSIFIDPMRTFLPFDGFLYPWEEMHRQQAGDVGKTERVLEELLNDGKLSQEEYEQALQLHQGPAWDRAMSLARLDDTEGRADAFDLMSLFSSPHAPLVWAYNIARGTPENIGTVLPPTRFMGQALGLLGLNPVGLLTPEAAIRKALGLPAFDKWDDYRVDRMLSNMAADGYAPVDEILRAMIDRDGPVFEEAQRRANKEWGLGLMGSFTGIPPRAYPTGEEHLRELSLDYQDAWRAYEGGVKTTLERFYDEHPEYEARLALFKKPNERLQNFLVDNLWDRWNGLTDVHKSQVAEQLGPQFEQAFLNRDTRSYENIPAETMGVWLKLMGGDPPGSMNSGQYQSLSLDLAPPEVAYRAQVFYDLREQQFDWERIKREQNEYFDKPEGERQSYRERHPDLVRYWTWRRDWLIRNPDAAAYITDDPPKSNYRAGPNFTSQEWQAILGVPMYRLAVDAAQGEDLPPNVLDRLNEIGGQLGVDVLEELNAVR